MTTKPVVYEWDGEAMRPLGHFSALCDRQFVEGERYRLGVVEERSRVSHSHYFASVAEAFANLPEAYKGRWLTDDDLRKHALIHTGFANPPQHFVTGSKAEAERLARALAKVTDEYAEIAIDGCTVTRLTARSQSYAGMPQKGEFQDSKQVVLEYLAAMLGVGLHELAAQAKRSAPTMRRDKRVA